MFAQKGLLQTLKVQAGRVHKMRPVRHRLRVSLLLLAAYGGVGSGFAGLAGVGGVRGDKVKGAKW